MSKGIYHHSWLTEALFVTHGVLESCNASVHYPMTDEKTSHGPGALQVGTWNTHSGQQPGSCSERSFQQSH